MLKKHHRKATHQGVLQGIAELLDRAGISHRAKRSSEEVNNCFEGKTLEGTHLYRVAKRKNSRTPTPCLRAFRRNRGLLPESCPKSLGLWLDLYGSTLHKAGCRLLIRHYAK